MKKITDSEKWQDLWYVSGQIGDFYNLIKTFPSWNPSNEEKVNYFRTNVVPIMAKKRKHILDIIDYRDGERDLYSIKVMVMTSNNGSNGWNAIKGETLEINKDVHGVLIISYPDSSRNISKASLYLITKTELIENFYLGCDNRVHLKSNDGSIDEYKLPSFDNNGNMALKLKLVDICNRLKLKPKYDKLWFKKDIEANYINKRIENK